MAWNFDYSSIGSIISLLEENGLSMTKKFGQNFLVSLQSLEKLVSLADIEKDTVVWEIGPGIGALTSVMLKRGAKVTAFEIDHGFCRILREKAFGDEKNFTLIEGDAVKNWLSYYKEHGKPDVICANLPYNVGSILIASFIENRCLPEKMVFTLQSEVVSRICAGIGDEDYSGFSILTSLDYDNKDALRLKPGCFYPSPNVDSSVVVMTKKENPLVPDDKAAAFLSFIRAAFSQRRKTLRNNIKILGIPAVILDKVFLDLSIPVSVRAEELDTKKLFAFFSLTEELKNQAQ